MLKEFFVAFQLIKPSVAVFAAVPKAAGVQAVPEATVGLTTSFTLIT